MMAKSSMAKLLEVFGILGKSGGFAPVGGGKWVGFYLKSQKLRQ